MVPQERQSIRSQLHLTDPYEGFTADPSQVDKHGWGGSHPVFGQIITKIKPKVVVEVGTWKGASLAQRQPKPGATCFKIDSMMWAL